MTDDFKGVFQTDSEIVLNQYKTNKNYLIVNTTKDSASIKKEKYCAIYFSSNNLYYPNDNNAFKKEIITKNKYEWYTTRINKAEKHIFIRDIFKQWYLAGINESLNTIEKLVDFLKEETKGYKTITVGSSSGGYASVLFGQLLSAEYCYSFNGQLQLFWQMQNSSPEKDPLLFTLKKRETAFKYYNIVNYIKTPSSILYFNSRKSEEDIAQLEYIKNINLNLFSFKTSHHGVPFISSILPKLLNMPVLELLKLKEKNHNPLIFSLKIGGIFTTIKGLKNIILNKIKGTIRSQKTLVRIFKNIRDGVFFKKSVSRKIKGKNNSLQIDNTVRFINCKINIVGESNTIIIQQDCLFKNVTFHIKGNNNTISIANNVQFNRSGEIWMEDDTVELHIDSGTTFEDTHLAITEPNSKIKIGTDCMFANGIDVRTGDSHSILNNTTKERINFAKNVTIGDHVWVGAHSSILKGVAIQDNCIVATRSVVSNSFEEKNIILGGIPAKKIKENITWDRKRLYSKQ